MIVLICVFSLFFILENIFPLRSRREGLPNRLLLNFSLAVLALPLTRLASFSLVYSATVFVNENNWGLFNIISAQKPLQNILGFIILDYSLYLWHVANHKVAFLWRFHQVHHSDRDMDTSTALRFHFGELVLSAVLRTALVFILGLKIELILFFDIMVTSIAIFHHSNLKIPVILDKSLSMLIVTPLYHQSHHSFYQTETDSNYSTIFSVWDKVHDTFSDLMNPKFITIGLPAFLQEKLSLLNLIKMPMNKLKSWPLEFKKRS